MERPSVVLVSMPWSTLTSPSLGLSVLKSSLETNDVPARVKYFNLLMLNYLKSSTYARLADAWGFNDFVFSGILHPEISTDQLDRLITYSQKLSETTWKDSGYSAVQITDLFLVLRNKIIPEYIQSCVEEIIEINPTLVGFTCMYDQTFASIGMSYVLKQKNPGILTCLGGYAVHGDTGKAIVKSFPFIDAVAIGDGEETVLHLADSSVGNIDLADIPGVLTSSMKIGDTKPACIELDSSPFPDFDDYFDDISQLKIDHKISIRPTALPAETSRGCWWGQNNHCIFCGIDEESLRYRQKDPDVALDLFAKYKEKYGEIKIQLSDYILPHNYYSKMLQKLIDRNLGLKLACEIKSNINRKKIKLLRKAGFVEVQPGIESFSSSCLKKMKKGVSAIQNIYTLKLGLEFDVKINYNILYGFPGDTVDEYKGMAKIIPSLFHLDPPVSHMKVFTTKYSPLFMDFRNFGEDSNLVHDSRYRLILPDDYIDDIGFDWDEYCYYFETPYHIDAELNEWYAVIGQQINYWQSLKDNKPELSYISSNNCVKVTDSRESTELVVYEISGLEMNIIKMAKSPVTIKQIGEKFIGSSTDKIKVAIDNLVKMRLVYIENELIVSLAIEKH